MTKYNLNNIIFNFSQDEFIDDEIGPDFIGSAKFHVPKTKFDQFAKFCSINRDTFEENKYKDEKFVKEIDTEYRKYYWIPVYLDELEIEHYLIVRQNDKYVTLTNATDLFIIFCKWCLNNTKRKFDVICEYSHISWMFHDMFHIQEHIDINYNIYVSHLEEYNAIKYSLDKCIEINDLLPYSQLEELVNQFNSRFRSKSGHNFFEDYEEYYLENGYELE